MFLLVFPENVLIIIISICNREKTMKYNYIVVGSGLYGAIFAHEAKAKGKSVLVVDKRPNIAGNVYTEKQEGINVHMYGAHIFHTNDKRVWNYITQFAEFNRFTNSPVANYKGELYSMPFNMYTFNKMWGVVTPEEAAAKIDEQKKEITAEPKNLEEQAISLVGRDIYEKLVKGYTEKQWGRDCKDLPSFIIKRLPVRLTFDNNYFNALYQGIPVGGYTKMIANLLDGIEVRLNIDYLEHKSELDTLADKVVYTGPIDAYFDYKLGTLEYRSVRFETETLDKPNFQGNAAVNYTDRETSWTRIIEHKWFEFGKDENGDKIKERRNGSGARVYGVNLDAKLAHGKEAQFQLGFTAQRSRYTKAEVWTEVDDEELTTKRMMRTPDYYGYFTFSSAPLKNFDFSLSGIYTGKMIVPHYAPVDAPEGAFCNIEKDRMENTPDFFDLNLKLNYTFVLHDQLQLNAGVQNIFNSFQKDLDKGEFRDSGYFYGPTQPRTFFIGFKIMN